MNRIDQALQYFVPPEGDPVACLAELVAAIRPAEVNDHAEINTRVRMACELLREHGDYRRGLRRALVQSMEATRQISLYAESGILPNSGFFSELFRRISRRLLPDVVERQQLKDLLGVMFNRSDDCVWLAAVSLDSWRALFAVLDFGREALRRDLSRTRYEMLEALQVLSFRVAAIGLDPELLRNQPELEEFESPFLRQNAEVRVYLEHYAAWLADATHPAWNDAEILRLLGLCRAALEGIKRVALQHGTSITMTYKMRRLLQILQRMEALLGLLAAWREADSDETLALRAVALLGELVREENCKNNLRDHFRQTLDLLALRVTENASRTGEHYITETRAEYIAMLRSALGGGLVVAVMAMFKLVIAKWHLAPLNEAIVVSLNYGIGFMLIHIFGFTVATKQPAMTAAAIAASIEEASGKTRSFDNLVTLIARTVRSQTIAILGNIGMAVPMAMLFGALLYALTGEHFITAEKADHLLDAVSPFGLTLFYAALAGVCLFLSGQIAGYYDNLCVYNRIPERLQQLGWLQRMLGEPRLERVTRYIENNLGALAGNFYLGVLLGGMTAIGVLFGAPVDVRHVTLSSAYWGFSLVALEFRPEWQAAVLAAVGVALIGLVNLAVSFSFALIVALKARQVSYEQGGWSLFLKVLRRFRRSPREFLLPPRKK